MHPQRAFRNLFLGRARRARKRGATKTRRRNLRRAHRALQRLRLARKASWAPTAKVTVTSVKRWFTRPFITPDLIVLHDTESPGHSGLNTSQYLGRGNVQADVHIVIDVDATVYRLVPDGRKAWHVVSFNSRALGIEQIGYAKQTTWPEAQLRESAKWIAFWSQKYGIPIRDARKDLTRGIVTHKSLGQAGGGHVDPGPSYPFDRVLALAKSYKGRV